MEYDDPVVQSTAKSTMADVVRSQRELRILRAILPRLPKLRYKSTAQILQCADAC